MPGDRAVGDGELVLCWHTEYSVIRNGMAVFAVASVAETPDGRHVTEGPRAGHWVRGHLKWKRLDLDALPDFSGSGSAEDASLEIPAPLKP